MVKRRLLAIVPLFSRFRAACCLPILTGLSWMLCVTGCTHGGDTSYRIAAESNLTRRVLPGRGFQHVVYESNLDNRVGGVLKVYIEGDGVPWHRGRVPSRDPTPREPLALRMMVQDATAAIYVGRPCYFGLQDSRNCNSDVWTFARYSPAVIASMARVVSRYAKTLDVTRLVLIGYSGGGAVAALVARDGDFPTYLLTIAGNLDTDAWTASRGFLPLDGSLNPADFIDELRHIPQLHLIAARDETVPPFVTRRYTDQLSAGSSRSYAKFDHSCCWVELWPKILEESPWSD